jgi:hypothetical protein
MMKILSGVQHKAEADVFAEYDSRSKDKLKNGAWRAERSSLELQTQTKGYHCSRAHYFFRVDQRLILGWRRRQGGFFENSSKA